MDSNHIYGVMTVVLPIILSEYFKRTDLSARIQKLEEPKKPKKRRRRTAKQAS